MPLNRRSIGGGGGGGAGGGGHVEKKTIIVRYEGRDHTVSWYSGASDAAISRTIDNALGLPRGTPAVVRDPEDGSALAISDSIPSGVTLDAKPAAAVAIPGAAAAAAAARGGNGVMGDPPAFIDGKKSKWHDGGGSGKGSDEGGGGSRGTSRSQSPPMNRSDDGFHGGGSDSGKGRGVEGGGSNGDGRGGVGEGGGGAGGVGGGGAKEFRGELLKFERVNAHLANERTWLAWVRTALSVLGVALSLISLADDMLTTSMDSVALALGVAFVLCTLFTYLTGWLRYTRVKEVLTWTGSQVRGKFNRFGLQYFSYFLGVSLVLTVPIYLIAGVDVIEEA